MEGAALGLEPGSIFADDFRVVRPLAAGGMGAVYVVDQLSTGKSRALKLMRAELAGDADLRRRFEQEAKIGSRIESDHVVEIQAAGVDEASATPYIVMELLVGEDLATRIDRAGPLGARETLDLFEQLCHAMEAAHSAGIVHRDLKPENVFLAARKRAGDARVDVKVLDFGIAKLVAESTTKGQTAGMIGTPLWMAPEQTERGPVTPAADVWALGLILYRALTGRIYWLTGNEPDATFGQVLKETLLGPLPKASERAREQGVGPLWPASLDAVFARSVARAPGHRYVHAGLFWTALREALTTDERSSARLVVAPPSGGAAAASPASGLDRTTPVDPMAAALPPGPPPNAATAPALVPPPGPALLSSSLGGPRDIAGVPLRVVLAGVSMLVVLGLFFTMALARKRASRAAQAREDEPEMIGPGGIRTAPPPSVARPDRCRLCSGAVTASGPLSREQVVAAVEQAFPLLDQQCLTRSRRRVSAGTTTLSFVVRDGRASTRQIEASTSKDGADECLVRAFADLAFPSTSEGTDVKYTLKYDPSVR